VSKFKSGSNLTEVFPKLGRGPTGSNPKKNPEDYHILKKNISHRPMTSLNSKVIFLRLSKGKNCISFEAVSMVVF
jgi:hypothetical protein